MADDDKRIRVRARDGAQLEWSRKAARRSGIFKNLMDDAPPEDGVYPVPLVSAAMLSKLGKLCEPDDVSTESLAVLSLEELFRMIEGAIYLDIPAEAVKHIQRAVATLLSAKRGVDLRELLDPVDDFESESVRMATLTEPVLTVPTPVHTSASGADGPPALQRLPSLWALPVTDDAQVTALQLVDVGTLIELKGVNRSWQSLARRVLFERLCHREGQPAPMPSQLSEVTDVDAKMLHDAGRPWEVAWLPGLERLHWDGWQVNVAAVRTVDLAEEDDEDDEEEGEWHDDNEEGGEWLSRAASAALHGCITGEGIPPLQLMLVAIVCSGSGEICGIPLEEMRTGSLIELSLHDQGIGLKAAKLLAYLMPLASSLSKIE